MLKRSCCTHASSFLQFRNQLPAVQSIQQIDIAGLTVQYGNWQTTTILHVDSGRLLVGVASIFQLHFIGHRGTSSLVLINKTCFSLICFQIDVANKERNLIVRIQAFPKHSRKCIDIAGNFHLFRLPRKAG